MYLTAVLLLLLILPAASVALEVMMHPGAAPLMALVGDGKCALCRDRLTGQGQDERGVSGAGAQRGIDLITAYCKPTSRKM